MGIDCGALGRALRLNGGQRSAPRFCEQGLDQRIRRAGPTVARTELLSGEPHRNEQNRRRSTEPQRRLACQTGVQSCRQRAAVSPEPADWS